MAQSAYCKGCKAMTTFICEKCEVEPDQELIRQRDALLAACEETVRCVGSNFASGSSILLLRKARAAIALVKHPAAPESKEKP